MFKRISLPLEAIAGGLRSLVGAVQSLSEATPSQDLDYELEGRVASLERTVDAKLAEAVAAQTMAKGHLQAARNAEERSRGMESRAQKLAQIVNGEDEEADPFEVGAAAFALEPGQIPPNDEGERRPWQDGRAIARAAKRSRR